MMGRLIRLAAAALVVYAAWHVLGAQWDHFKFQDAVTHVSEFSSGQDEDAVRAALLKEAVALGLPVDPAKIVVDKNDQRIHIEVPYIAPVRIVPGYTYQWPFTTSADTSYIPGSRLR